MEIGNDLLTRYFLGESNEIEKEAIRDWLEADEANRKAFTEERIRFDASLLVDESEIARKRSTSPRLVTLKLLKVASIILLVVISSIFTLHINNYRIESNVTEQNIYVPAGNRTELVLPDGSIVWLNSNTNLRYPNLFTGKERIVELDGEALFEVTQDTKKPFIVKTGQYNIEVLGTIFSVEAYKEKADFTTILYSGSIRVFNNQTETYDLNSGEMAKLVDGWLQVIPTESTDPGWREGLIVIENKSFEETMLLFEKYFGVRIYIDNSQIKEAGYRGKLRIKDGVDHALRVLQNDVPFEYNYDKENNTIHIY